MTRVLAVLIVEISATDWTLATLLLERQLPQAVVRRVHDALALSDALSDTAPDVALVAADLTWARLDEVVDAITRRSPDTAVVLFGHTSDLVERALDPGLACDGILTKTSAGFLALGSVITKVLERHSRSRFPRALDATRTPAARVPIPTANLHEHDPEQDRREIALLFSHDLREPVQQLVRLARHGQTAADPEAVGRVLSHVLDRAERLSSMLDGLTEYLIVGGRTATPTVIDLKACVDKAVENLRSSVIETQAEIRVSGERLLAIGDEQQIIHLFQNLLSNAIKFRSNDRPVIAVTAHRSGDHWLIQFRDNGIGIPEASLQRIFDLGARLHSGPEYQGAGIGLALCRRIVERHGGRIWVESRRGEGASFFVSLPCAPASEEGVS